MHTWTKNLNTINLLQLKAACSPDVQGIYSCLAYSQNKFCLKTLNISMVLFFSMGIKRAKHSEGKTFSWLFYIFSLSLDISYLNIVKTTEFLLGTDTFSEKITVQVKIQFLPNPCNYLFVWLMQKFWVGKIWMSY